MEYFITEEKIPGLQLYLSDYTAFYFIWWLHWWPVKFLPLNFIKKFESYMYIHDMYWDLHLFSNPTNFHCTQSTLVATIIINLDMTCKLKTYFHSFTITPRLRNCIMVMNKWRGLHKDKRHWHQKKKAINCRGRSLSVAYWRVYERQEGVVECSASLD